MKSIQIPHQQNGSVLVLTAVGLLVLVGVGSLAIDLSHAYTNKTRLQNLADSLALSAAMSLNKGEKSTTYPDEERYAQYYATQYTYPAFKANSSNQEIASSFTDNSIDNSQLVFTFATNWSSTASDWRTWDNISGARFARVTVNENNSAVNFLNTWFGKLFGFNQIPVSTSAVAGTVPVAPCNILPIMMCGQTYNRNVAPDPADGSRVDKDCTNDNDDNPYAQYPANPTNPNYRYYDPDNPSGTPWNGSSWDSSNDIDNDNPDCYGYERNVVYAMHAPDVNQPAQPLPGNWGLFDAGNGGSDIRECLAGNTSCSSNLCSLFTQNPDDLTLSLTSETGNKVGPIKQGLNTRFDDYTGGMSYPEYKPDSNVLGSLSQEERYAFHEFDTDNGIAYQTTAPNFGLGKNSSSANAYTSTSKQRFNTGGYNPDYLSRSTIDSGSGHSFIRGHRLIGVPFVSCTNQNGKKQFEVLGFGCFFLTHTTDGKDVYGEFVGNDKCLVSGKSTSSIDMDFYKVILYKDPFGAHS